MGRFIKGREGYSCLGNVYYKYKIANEDAPIVITFSYLGANAKRAEAKSGVHSPWAYDFIVSKGLNALSFCCIGNNNWYTDKIFQEKVEGVGEEIKKTGLKILGYGGSMGGFGVSALANPLGIEEMLLFNPISTLNSEKAPFEYRFSNARNKLDWSCPYNDGADAYASGYVIYDPFFKVDALHAERYLDLEKLKFPGVGHSIPNHLAKVNALKWVFSSFLDGRIDKVEFGKKVREKRKYPHYYKWMMGPENAYLTEKRKEVVERYYNSFMLLSGETSILQKEDIDFIRDLAISQESEDLNTSYRLMKMAEKLRPRGPFIRKKVREYSVRVKKGKINSM